MVSSARWPLADDFSIKLADDVVDELAPCRKEGEWEEVHETFIETMLRQSSQYTEGLVVSSRKTFSFELPGRSLIRLTDNSLLRLEIVNPEHRQAILREIAKLRLRGKIGRAHV